MSNGSDHVVTSPSTSELLDDDGIYENPEAIRKEKKAEVELSRPLTPETGLMETAIGGRPSDKYGTFARKKSCAKLNLDQRREIRSSQQRQLKELKQEMGKTDQLAAKCVLYIDNTSKRWDEFRRTYLKIWGGSIKQIEGHLGSGVCTYFKVLVWLLKINVFCVLLGVGFIVGPGSYMSSHHDHIAETTYNKDDLKCTNPNFVNGTGTGAVFVNGLLQFLTGTGWMEGTALFYGWYPPSNLTMHVHGKEKTTYFFPLAYFCCGCSYFLISLLLMLGNLSRLFKKSAAEQISTIRYSSIVFTWDFTLHNQETSTLKSVTICKALKEELEEDDQQFLKRDFSTKIGIFFLRICTNLLCVAAMVGTVYLYVDQVLTDSRESLANSTNSCGKLVSGDGDNNEIDLQHLSQINITEELTAFWNTYSASIIVSGSNIVFPIFFQIVGSFEMYQFQSTRIGITLLRMFIMKLFSVSTFLYVLYTAASPSGGRTADWQNRENTLHYNCWEDYIGSQLYQLIMVDFFIFCIVLLFAEVLRALLVNHVALLRDRVGLTKSEFNIPKEVLDLVYKQMICWSGFYFLPLLPVVAVIEVVLIFYLRKASALRNVVPPETVVLNNQSTSTINALFMTSLLVVFVFIGLVIFNFTPSKLCGPFRDYERFSDPLTAVIDQSGVFKRYIVDNIKTTSVFIIIVILVALVIYYYRSLAASREVMIDLLKAQVRDEIAGKHMLATRVETVQKKAKAKDTGAMKWKNATKKLLRRQSTMHGFADVTPDL